ncbi:MAG TPA: dethiobiotin synthase [Steroidobacteraceae bacterium]|nr:dethiobiotin synthase [Steroidobacteraceae bacterium]
MTPGLFVTGTNTGVGKTLVAVAWTQALARRGHRVVALKPIASGAERDAAGRLRNADARALQAAASVALPYELVNPYCFEPPIAPHLAAEEAQVATPPARLVEHYRRATAGADLAVVEGAGGWRVPLYPEGFLSDLPEQLGLGVVLVVGLTLGCLNHARLTLEAIERSGRCAFIGWVGNAIDPAFERVAANVRTLERLTGAAPLAIIPTLRPEANRDAVSELFESRTMQAAVARLMSGTARP